MTKNTDLIHRLRLSRARLDALVEAVDRTERAEDHDQDRDYPRRPVHRPAVLAQMAPGEVASKHEVYLRNVSRSGVSMLHSAFVQNRLECTLILLTSDRRPVTVTGHVVRCVHVSGPMHEVGFRFENGLTEEQTISIVEVPTGVQDASIMSPEQHAKAFDQCKDLVCRIHEMINSGATPEEVLPVLDELRAIEPIARRAA